jgi:Protein of unknown function (DUF2490)
MRMKNFIFTLIILCFAVSLAKAQTTVDEEDFQSWNDVQLTLPLNKQFDFIVTGTLRFGNNVERLVDRRIGAAVNFKVTSWLSLQPIYTNIVTTPRNARRRNENRLSFAATYRFPFKKFTLTDRNMFERRFRSPRNSTRYRNRLQLEVPLKNFYDTRFFVSDEIFYDWSLEKWSRNRFSVGLGKAINKRLTLDVYYMRQNDGTTVPGDLNVIGTTWRIRLR